MILRTPRALLLQARPVCLEGRNNNTPPHGGAAGLCHPLCKALGTHPGKKWHHCSEFTCLDVREKAQSRGHPEPLLLPGKTPAGLLIPQPPFGFSLIMAQRRDKTSNSHSPTPGCSSTSYSCVSWLLIYFLIYKYTLSLSLSISRDADTHLFATLNKQFKN